MTVSKDPFEILRTSLPTMRRRLIAHLDQQIRNGAPVVSVVNGELLLHDPSHPLQAMVPSEPRFDFA